MSKIKIISDSTCDLTQDLVAKYDVGIVPLYVNLGGKVCKDNGVEITPQIIYDYVDKTGTLPSTIGVSVQDFKDEFKKWHDEGYEIICHTISSDISCSYQSAKIAADEIGGVYVVDSRNLSTGIAHLVINSANLASQGLEAKEIFESSQTLANKLNTTFIIDTLDYMKKGGRCSSVIALGANLLKIKPMITLENGKMKVAKKFRGTLTKVLENYVDTIFEKTDNIRTERLFITHTGCSKEILDLVTSRIKSHINFDEIYITIAGATVTSHSGPNTLGILFINK